MASSGLGTAGRPWRAVFVSCRPPRTLRSSVLYKPVGIKAGLCKWQPLSPRGLVRLAAAEPSTATGRQAPVTKKALRSHTKADLMRECSALGLSTYGYKEELVDRLLSTYNEQIIASPSWKIKEQKARPVKPTIPYNPSKDAGSALQASDEQHQHLAQDSSAATVEVDETAVSRAAADALEGAPAAAAPQEDQAAGDDRLPSIYEQAVEAAQAAPLVAAEESAADAAVDGALPTAAPEVINYTLQSKVEQLNEVMKQLGLPVAGEGGARKPKALKLRELAAFAEQHPALTPADSSGIAVEGVIISRSAVPVAGDAVPAGAPAEPLEEALRGGSAAAAQPTLEAAQVEGALPGAQEDLDSLTKEELSQRCRALELPAYGKKQVLIARLQERLALQDAGVAAAASGVEGLDAAPGREPPPGLQEQPLYIYGPSSSPADLRSAIAELSLVESTLGYDRPMLWGTLTRYAQAHSTDSATDRSSVAVGLSIIHKNARAPTPPFPYKYLDAWSKEDSRELLRELQQPISGTRPQLADRLLKLAQEQPQLSPLLAGIKPRPAPVGGSQELELLAQKAGVGAQELAALEDSAMEQQLATEADTLGSSGITAHAPRREGVVVEPPVPPAEEVPRSVGGDLEFDTQPPGVKQRSGTLEAVGPSPMPAEEAGDTPAFASVADSPLDEMPLSTNTADADPYNADATDPVAAEADQVDEPTLEELEALQDLEPGEEERDALDFRSEDRFGPQERGTARRSQGINYTGDAQAMMEGEGFEEGDEDGIIAELEDRGDRASDLAAGDLGRQGQNQMDDMPFGMWDEALDSDVSDGDDEFPGTEDLPPPSQLQDQEQGGSQGAVLRNPSRLQLLGLARDEARPGAGREGAQEEWQAEERPTVADLDAMGWFDEGVDYEGPAALPGWLQSGAQGPRRRSGTQDSLSDDSELDRQGGNSRYAYGYYNPMSTDGEDEEEEEPLSAPLPAAAAGFSSSPNETAAAKRRNRRSRKRRAALSAPEFDEAEAALQVVQDPDRMQEDVEAGLAAAADVSSARRDLGTQPSAEGSQAMPSDIQELLRTEPGDDVTAPDGPRPPQIAAASDQELLEDLAADIGSQPEASQAAAGGSTDLSADPWDTAAPAQQQTPAAGNTAAAGSSTYESVGLSSGRPAPLGNSEAQGTPAEQSPAVHAGRLDSTSHRPSLDGPENSPAVRAGQISSIREAVPTTAPTPGPEQSPAVQAGQAASTSDERPLGGPAISPAVRAGQISSITEAAPTTASSPRSDQLPAVQADELDSTSDEQRLAGPEVSPAVCAGQISSIREAGPTTAPPQGPEVSPAVQAGQVDSTSDEQPLAGPEISPAVRAGQISSISETAPSTAPPAGSGVRTDLSPAIQAGQITSISDEQPTDLPGSDTSSDPAPLPLEPSSAEGSVIASAALDDLIAESADAVLDALAAQAAQAAQSAADQVAADSSEPYLSPADSTLAQPPTDPLSGTLGGAAAPLPAQPSSAEDAIAESALDDLLTEAVDALDEFIAEADLAVAESAEPSIASGVSTSDQQPAGPPLSEADRDLAPLVEPASGEQELLDDTALAAAAGAAWEDLIAELAADTRLDDSALRPALPITEADPAVGATTAESEAESALLADQLTAPSEPDTALPTDAPAVFQPEVPLEALDTDAEAASPIPPPALPQPPQPQETADPRVPLQPEELDGPIGPSDLPEDEEQLPGLGLDSAPPAMDLQAPSSLEGPQAGVQVSVPAADSSSGQASTQPGLGGSLPQPLEGGAQAGVGPLAQTPTILPAVPFTSAPAPEVPPGLFQGVEEEGRNVHRLRLQIREKQQKLAALQEKVKQQEDPSWAEAMKWHIQVEALRAEREALEREAKAGNLADLRSATSRSRMDANVKGVVQSTLGRIEAELAGLDADVVQCDAAAARLHRELAKARERSNPVPQQPVLEQESSTATAVVSRRTNGAHLPSLEGVKAGELPEGFLYEATDLPEEAVKKRGRERVNPGVLAAATMMGAYKMAQGFWGRIGKPQSNRMPRAPLQKPDDDADDASGK